MPEAVAITRAFQIGVETTPGTSVAANRALRSIAIEPGAQTKTQLLRNAGGKFPVAAALGKDWTEADFSGYLTYTEIVYLLSSLLKAVTPVQITPPSGLAYRWTFAPAQSTPDTVKTYTVESGTSAQAQKFTYGLVSKLTLSIDRDKAALKGSFLGRELVDGITLTPSPSVIELVPVVPGAVSIYLDNTLAGIGTTKLQRVLSAEFEIGERFSPVWSLDAARASFAAHVEKELNATLKLTLAADAAGMAPLAALRAGDKRYIRLLATGPNIETGNDYLFQIDMAALVSDVGDFSDEDGVWAIEWTFTATYDADWSGGRALEVKVVNTLSGL